MYCPSNCPRIKSLLVNLAKCNAKLWCIQLYNGETLLTRNYSLNKSILVLIFQWFSAKLPGTSKHTPWISLKQISRMTHSCHPWKSKARPFGFFLLCSFTTCRMPPPSRFTSPMRRCFDSTPFGKRSDLLVTEVYCAKKNSTWNSMFIVNQLSTTHSQRVCLLTLLVQRLQQWCLLMLIYIYIYVYNYNIIYIYIWHWSNLPHSNH